MVRPIFESARRYTVGLLAQILTLTATVIPIFAGEQDQLVWTVAVQAGVNVLTPLLTLAVMHTLPAENKIDTAQRLVGSAIFWVITGCILLVLAALLLASAIGYKPTAELTIGTFLFAVGSMLFVIMLAIATHALDLSAIYLLRLIFGVMTFALTLLAVFFWSTPAAYLLAPAISYFASVVIVLILTNSLRSFVGSSIRKTTLSAALKDARHAATLSWPVMMGTLAAQAPAFVTPFLGHLAGSWVIVTRIAGGFQTIGAQVIGPQLDVAAAAAMRKRNSAQVRSTRRQVLTLSIALAGLTSLSVLAMLSLFGNTSAPLVLVAAALYAIGTGLNAPSGRILGFLSQRSRAVWDLSRTITTAAALIGFSGVALITSLGIVTLTAAVTYLALILYFLTRLGRDSSATA